MQVKLKDMEEVHIKVQGEIEDTKMPCYHPLTGYRSRLGRNENGNWPIVFNITDGYSDLVVTVPCGRCIGCKLEMSRQWAVRCVHESKMHEDNCFITLTYDNEHLPEGNTLVKKDYVGFMKRLRKKYEKSHKIRFFHCGEYGEQLQRPHHHACLFGHDFTDKILISNKRGTKLYVSDELNAIWQKGYCIIGDVTFDSAAYVARYCTKKITGEKAESHYNGRVPEYVTMSRRPGIATNFYLKYKDDILYNDRVIMRDGKECKPARFYDKIYERSSPDDYQLLKAKRKRKASSDLDNTPERLEVKERIKKLNARVLKRSYESGTSDVFN